MHHIFGTCLNITFQDQGQNFCSTSTEQNIFGNKYSRWKYHNWILVTRLYQWNCSDLFLLTGFMKAQETYLKNIHRLRWLAGLKWNCFFMEWFYYNLIILIKQCQIPHKNLDKALLFSRNQVFCLKTWKLWRAPTTLFAKIKKDLVPTHSFLHFY